MVHVVYFCSITNRTMCRVILFALDRKVTEMRTFEMPTNFRYIVGYLKLLHLVSISESKSLTFKGPSVCLVLWYLVVHWWPKEGSVNWRFVLLWFWQYFVKPFSAKWIDRHLVVANWLVDVTTYLLLFINITLDYFRQFVLLYRLGYQNKAILNTYNRTI